MAEKPLPELHGPVLLAARAELSLPATKRKEPIGPAGVPVNADMTVVQVTAFQVLDDDLFQSLIDDRVRLPKA